MVGNQVAAVQLGISGKLRRDRSACGYRQDPVGLLEAELRPGVVQGRPAHQQDQVMSGLGPVEERPVHGGWLAGHCCAQDLGPAEHGDR